MGAADESSEYAESVLSAVEHDVLRAPELWAREIANGVTIASRRKRITFEGQQNFLLVLSRLKIDVQETDSAFAVIRDGTAAAIRYGLTAYDAAYVDLAARDGLELATLDRAMIKAAEGAGLPFLERSGSFARI